MNEPCPIPNCRTIIILREAIDPRYLVGVCRHCKTKITIKNEGYKKEKTK